MWRFTQQMVHGGNNRLDGHRRPAAAVCQPDHISLVGFADSASVISEPRDPYDALLLQSSQSLHTRVGGCTNIAAGLRTAVQMVRQSPPGMLRRIWLLSDGHPNREVDRIMAEVEEARRAWANVNTIGFGDRYDEALLRAISAMTHRGRFVPVATLRELTNALVIASDENGRTRRHHHRAETTVLAIDLSGSMNEPMEGKTKVAVVEEAVLRFLHYKQQCFA